MYFVWIESDQLYTWSDENRERACCHIEKTSADASASVAPAQVNPTRLADRALQTLWQAGLQMCRRFRPRPEVLSFGEPSGLAAANGLCAARISRPDCRVRRQLPSSPRNLRSDLRDQPRTVAPPGGALKGRYERSALCPPCIHRCRIGRRAPRQHGRSLAGWQPGWFDKRGDNQ
jgi:hypothetical protein